MNEKDLHALIDRVKHGRLSRRGFIERMAGLGLTAPMASQMLAYSGVAQAQSGWAYKPTRRGGGTATSRCRCGTQARNHHRVLDHLDALLDGSATGQCGSEARGLEADDCHEDHEHTLWDHCGRSVQGIGRY